MRAVGRAMLRAIGGLTAIAESGVAVTARPAPAFSRAVARPPAALSCGAMAVAALHGVAPVEDLAPRETSGNPAGS